MGHSLKTDPDTAAHTTATHTLVEPTQIDQFIGVRIRSVRETRGMSQRELAERCGISSPQIQKYEHGQNRISVARMLDLSKALNVVPEYFFNDLLESERPEADEDEMDIAQAVQAARVGRWWASITDPMTRIHIRELLRCLANQESLHGVIPHGGSPAVTRNKAKRKEAV